MRDEDVRRLHGQTCSGVVDEPVVLVHGVARPVEHCAVRRSGCRVIVELDAAHDAAARVLEHEADRLRRRLDRVTSRVDPDHELVVRVVDVERLRRHRGGLTDLRELVPVDEHLVGRVCEWVARVDRARVLARELVVPSRQHPRVAALHETVDDVRAAHDDGFVRIRLDRERLAGDRHRLAIDAGAHHDRGVVRRGRHRVAERRPGRGLRPGGLVAAVRRDEVGPGRDRVCGRAQRERSGRTAARRRARGRAGSHPEATRGGGWRDGQRSTDCKCEQRQADDRP